MSDVVIELENLGKLYHIGKKHEKHQSIREAATEMFVSPFRHLGRRLSGRAAASADSEESVWALKDVSCQIKRGEVVGLIGRNGAGKSTLLKLLSRITEPTCGYGDIRGRIGSLLEVGAGFHPELTGRENIFLNGAILGMKKAEIVRKFDEIIAFAEIDKFLDTPVKRYSSGMYMRLAFAVAAHLEPEILLVDEVLAVGDMHFQKKCLNKMESVGRQGRTVLFVSHSIQSITRLCERIILLSEGSVLDDGPSYRVVGTYLNTGLGTTAAREWRDIEKAPGDGVARLRAVRVRTDDGQVADAVDIRRPICVEIEYDVLEPGWALVADYCFHNAEGVRLFETFENDSTWAHHPHPTGRYVSTAWIPGNFLAEGTTFASVGVCTWKPQRVHFAEENVVAFQVVDTLDGDSARGNYGGHLHGAVRPLLRWATRAALDDPDLIATGADQVPAR